MPQPRRLTAHDLLAGTAAVHEVVVPDRILRPAGPGGPSGSDDASPDPDDLSPGVVRLRPLTVGTLVLVSRAARDDPSLVPLLLVKESLVEPVMSVDQLRRLHAGLVHYLVRAVNTISGLSPDGDVLDGAIGSPAGQVHLLLARHFGWSPEQVAKLTPGQVAVYLAGVDALLRDGGRPGPQPVATAAPTGAP